jgi:death on curing protein
MILLSELHVIGFHKRLIDATGGTHGLRDEGVLKSSLNNAFATFAGEDLYPTIIEKAANICFCLIENHPFVDGNKRIGLFVMLTLLEINEIMLNYAQDELVQLGMNIADGRLTQAQIIDWINDHKK